MPALAVGLLALVLLGLVIRRWRLRYLLPGGRGPGLVRIAAEAWRCWCCLSVSTGCCGLPSASAHLPAPASRQTGLDEHGALNSAKRPCVTPRRSMAHRAGADRDGGRREVERIGLVTLVSGLLSE